jgi:hypothetical protein
VEYPTQVTFVRPEVFTLDQPPKNVLLFPLFALLLPAFFPMATLPVDVVVLVKVVSPMAVLSLPVVSAVKAKYPTAVLECPVVFASRE